MHLGLTLPQHLAISKGLAILVESLVVGPLSAVIIFIVGRSLELAIEKELLDVAAGELCGVYSSRSRRRG